MADIQSRGTIAGPALVGGLIVAVAEMGYNILPGGKPPADDDVTMTLPKVDVN